MAMTYSETPTQTVPAATQATQQQQQTGAAGVDIISQLITTAREADTRAAEAAKAATIPITGGHVAPQSFNLPGAGRQYKQFELDTSPVTGKHQATMQGLANLSKSVANVVGQVQQQRDQKKTQELSVNIEHLMTAVASEDQAKQVLAQDPNNQAAKDQLAKAQGIQSEVLNDDKNRKAIAKAFNINFVDPSKNNTPEHAAMKQATDSYAKQFSSKLPTQMAPNQQAIAAAQTAAAEAKAANTLVEKIAPAVIAAQSRQQVAMTEGFAKEQAARTEAEARFKTAKYTADRSYDRAIEGQNIHVRGMLQAVHDHDSTLLTIAQDKIDQLNGVNGKSPKAIQEAQRSFDSISKTLLSHQTHINLLEQNRKNANAARVEGYNRQIRMIEDEDEVLLMKQKELASRLSSAGEIPVTGETQAPPDDKGGSDGGEPIYINNDSDQPDAGDGYDQQVQQQ
jgi:hypothetical protein